MPLIAVVAAAGVFAGLWLRSEGDTNGSSWSADLKWSAVAVAAFAAGRYLSGR